MVPNLIVMFKKSLIRNLNPLSFVNLNGCLRSEKFSIDGLHGRIVIFIRVVVTVFSMNSSSARVLKDIVKCFC
jgi:hypothetical protein